MTADLVAFLRARLDEDQREAEAAMSRTTTTRRWIGGQWVEDTVQPPEWRTSVWPPARVLAEVEAKRRFLGDYRNAETSLSASGPGTPPHDIMTGATNTLRRMLCLLALPYAGYPDYREEWRP